MASLELHCCLPKYTLYCPEEQYELVEPLVHLKYAEPSQTPAQSFVLEMEQDVPYLGSVILTVQLSPAAIVETFPLRPEAEAVFTPDVCKLETLDTLDADAERLFQSFLQLHPM